MLPIGSKIAVPALIKVGMHPYGNLSRRLLIPNGIKVLADADMMAYMLPFRSMT